MHACMHAHKYFALSTSNSSLASSPPRTPSRTVTQHAQPSPIPAPHLPGLGGQSQGHTTCLGTVSMRCHNQPWPSQQRAQHHAYATWLQAGGAGQQLRSLGQRPSQQNRAAQGQRPALPQTHDSMCPSGPASSAPHKAPRQLQSTRMESTEPHAFPATWHRTALSSQEGGPRPTSPITTLPGLPVLTGECQTLRPHTTEPIFPDSLHLPGPSARSAVTGFQGGPNTLLPHPETQVVSRARVGVDRALAQPCPHTSLSAGE